MHRFFYTLGLFSLAFWGCGGLPLGRPESLALLSWNVQNLFDEVKDGGEYPEFDPEKGWTRKKYWDRLERCAGVIEKAGPRLPDLVFLQELENPGVLETLRTRFLDAGWFSSSLMVPQEGSSVHAGLLSRWPVLRSGVLCPEDLRSGGRPVLEVLVQTPWGELTFFNNHWKSRLPDRDSTEPARRILAGLLKQRLRALASRGDFFLALGDFNTYPEQGLSGALGRQGLGVLEIRAPGESGGASGLVLDDIWNHVPEEGSYFFRGRWEPLDHILFLPREGIHLSFSVLSPPGIVSEKGVPLSWLPGRPQGVSDHLPLWAEIKFQEPDQEAKFGSFRMRDQVFDFRASLTGSMEN